MIGLAADGWVVFDRDRRVTEWAAAAHETALGITADPGQRTHWLRHGSTWFVGVDTLPNAPDGSIAGVRFTGPWQEAIPDLPLHPAQVSVIYPGYPGRDPGDTDAAHRYRVTRDAAHLDGLLAEGPVKRRHLREPHAYVLGIALTEADHDASPLVVWHGSHEIIRAALRQALAGIPPENWGDVDLTKTYQAARTKVFETCDRSAVPLALGQSVLVHRLAIHGVAPWAAGAKAAPEGRMIAYFRPQYPDPRDWLDAP